MKKLPSIIKFELRRNWSKRFVLVCILFLVTSLLLLQFGIDKYNNIQKDSSEFLQSEQKKIERYDNINQFCTYGLRNITVPSALFPLFYDSTPLGNLQGFLDVSVRVKIYKPQKGRTVLDNSFGGSLDFSWFLLYIGGIAALMFGFFSFRNREYIRFMLSFTSRFNVYGGILLSRAILVIGVLIINCALALILLYINGINPGASDISNLLIFFLISTIAMIFFLTIGSLFGTIRNIFKAFTVALISWFLLTILIPKIFNVVLAKSSDMVFKPLYLNEIKKLDILYQAEKSILKEVSKQETPSDIKSKYIELLEQYYNNDFQDILKLEDEMIENTFAASKKVHLLGIFTPVTFYNSLNNELSGQGYNEYLNFYKKNRDYYSAFVKYWLDNSFNGTKPKDKPFLKDSSDYIYRGESSLPKNFGAGLLLNLFYVLVVFCIGYLRFNRAIFEKPQKVEAFKNLKLDFESGQHVACYYYRQELPVQFYNMLSGRSRISNSNITLDGESLTAGKKRDFIYLPATSSLPGEIKTDDLLDTAGALLGTPKPGIEELKQEYGDLMGKRYSDLGRFERVKFLLIMLKLKPFKIYLLDNFFINFQQEELKETAASMTKGDDTAIIECLSVGSLNHNVDRFFSIYYDESSYSEREFDFKDRD